MLAWRSSKIAFKQALAVFRGIYCMAWPAYFKDVLIDSKSVTMATTLDPELRSTGVVDDGPVHDDVTGLKLSYNYCGCLFTVLISNQFPQGTSKSPTNRIVEDLIDRYNEAGYLTDADKTMEDFDKRLDPVWQEAEDLVRDVAFEQIKRMGRKHGQSISVKDSRGEEEDSLATYLYPLSFHLQLVPENGMLKATYRPDIPPCSPFVVEPTIAPEPGLMSIAPKNIQVLERFRGHILKVQVKEKLYCCKLNNTEVQNSFMREFETLQQIRHSHLRDQIRVPQLRGVVEVEEGVIGLLLDLVETQAPDLMVLLKRELNITHAVRQRWVSQIEETLQQLHSLDLVWGDAKTANIIIDKSDCPWLVDFGGGITKGWIDDALYDTQAGDLQGLENTTLDVFGQRHLE